MCRSDKRASTRRRSFAAITYASIRRAGHHRETRRRPQIALSLPETTEQPHFDYASFRVGGKIFATVPPEGEHVHVFVGEALREQALALESASIEKLFWGQRAVGLRIALKKAKPAVVARLLAQAWTGKAPKRLAAMHAAPD